MSRGSAENRFCNVQIRTWDDPDFCDLSSPPANAQTLWMYLLSGPYTTRVPGVLFGGRAAMAEALHWSQQDFDNCFAEIESKGMAVADWRARIVYLPKAFAQPTNWPHSPSVCVTWRKVINDLPECDLVRRIDHDLRMRLLELGEQFLNSYSDGKRTDTKHGSAASPAPSSAGVSAPQKTSQTVEQIDQQSDPHSHARQREGTGTDTDLGSSSGSSPSRALVNRTWLAERWGRWGTRVALPRGDDIERALRLIEGYAAASAESDMAALCERAVKAFLALLASWSFNAAATPMLFVEKWDDIQAVLGGMDPSERRNRSGPRSPDSHRGQASVARGLDFSKRGAP